MRETAGDLQAASELPRDTEEQREARRAAVRAAAPAAWTQYVGVLLPKPGEDAALFGRKRDVWLQLHGLKLFMLTLKPEYDLAVERHSGFRAGRNAPEATVVLALAR